VRKARTHIGHGSQRDIDALAAVLLPHSLTARLDETNVPRRRNVDTSRERRHKVGEPDTEWGVFETKAFPADTRDRLRARD
jgi:hypothetical protein